MPPTRSAAGRLPAPPPDRRPGRVGRPAARPVRTAARQRRSEWRRAEKARRYAARNSVRFPIFTRSVLLWMLIFALTGLAFGASGAFWWANFNSQVSQLRSDTQDFEARSQSAASSIDAQRKKALAQIAAATAPLERHRGPDPGAAAGGQLLAVGLRGGHPRQHGQALGGHRLRGAERRRRPA